LTRSGKLEEIYKNAYTKFKTPKQQYDDFGKLGLYINDVTNGLKENGYPFDELLNMMTSDEAIQEATKNGLDKKVAKGLMTYLAVITPGTTITNKFPLHIREFGTFFENIDKYGLKDDTMKALYNGLKQSNYKNNFDLGL
jgi:hypothetical protein